MSEEPFYYEQEAELEAEFADKLLSRVPEFPADLRPPDEEEDQEHEHSELRGPWTLRGNTLERETYRAPDPGPPLRAKGNTGVKGVLEDYKEDLRQKAQERQESAQKFWDGAARFAIDPRAPERSSAAEEEDDEEFMRLRQMRIEQMRKNVTRAQFGKIFHADDSNFLDSVSRVPENTFVIVHLYQPEIEACRLVNQHFEKLAKSQPHIKFVDIISTDALPNLHDSLLPAILVYKNCDLFAQILNLTEELGRKFSSDDLENLLAEHEVIM